MPIGTWWLADPSRDADEWSGDARTHLARRYTERQVRSTREAIVLLREAHEALGGPLPPPVDQAAIPSGATRPA